MTSKLIKSLLAGLLLTFSLTATAQSLVGVWEMVETETIGGPDAGVYPVPNYRLLIYTESYFSWIFDQATGPRPMLPPPAETSDAEFGAVARFMNVSGGTYQRVGSTIIYNRLVAVAPNAMAPENQPLVREIRTLTPFRLETQVTNNQGITQILRYRRAE